MGTYGGKYDQLITIRKPVYTKQANGEKKITSWDTVATDVPAAKKSQAGNEGVESEQRVATQNLLFTIRYPFSFIVNETMELEFEGRTYKITNAQENDQGRKVEMNITCQAKDNS